MGMESTVYFKGLVTILACAGLFLLLAIPLILRKIPRNSLYGFRTLKTLKSDRVWYEANFFFGWGMVFSSLTSAAAIIILYKLAVLTPNQYINSSLVILAVPIVMAILLTLLRIQKIKDTL